MREGLAIRNCVVRALFSWVSVWVLLLQQLPQQHQVRHPWMNPKNPSLTHLRANRAFAVVNKVTVSTRFFFSTFLSSTFFG
jgi:hypothetical protein